VLRCVQWCTPGTFIHRSLKCSICQKSSGGAEGKGRQEGVSPFHQGEGASPSPEILIFFHFKIVHSGAFSYTNCKVLFVIKCRERYVITVFLAIDSDTDMKTSSYFQSRKLFPVQSVGSNLHRFYSYSRHERVFGDGSE